MKSSREVLRVSTRNKFKRWIPAIESERGDPRSAQARLAQYRYFIAATAPRFRLNRTDRVFTIGSCFARNVENALLAQGLDLLTSDLAVDFALLTQGQVSNVASSVRAILNKYSTSAIRNELERALRDEIVAPSFIEVGNDLFIDPHLALLKPMPRDKLSSVRAEVDRVIRGINQANVVFVTLGLTETWYDNETRCFLNSSPPPALDHMASGWDGLSNKVAGSYEPWGSQRLLAGNFSRL